MPSAPHPTIFVTARPCPEDHIQFGHPVTKGTSLQSAFSSPVVADTGCQSTAIPPSYAYKVGYKKKDFIPVANRMNGAGRSDLGVIGAVVVKFTCTGPDGKTQDTTQLCYVCDRISSVYLSRSALEDLQCIPSQFPMPLTAQQIHSSAALQSEGEVATPRGNQQAEDNFSFDATCPFPSHPQHKPEDVSTSVAVCSCPLRPQQPPPIPTAIPPGIDIKEAGSVDKLRT